jgi:phenylalanyl-tRNA synthetase beta chain
MKFTFSWLKSHLETQASLDVITEKLTSLGLEVESVENPGESLKSFKIAHILEAHPHPNADRLQVCSVDIGEGKPLQVVCGAPNARKGLKVVFAGPGVVIPATQQTLKLTKVRDVESMGMLCSASELNLPSPNPESGILELHEEAPVGHSYADYLHADDPVIEIKITPNRGDCLGIRGIARDLAAAGLGTLKTLPYDPIKGSFKSPLSLKRSLPSEDIKACPHFIGRYIKGVQNQPSPLWLQQRLESIGLKPISALVDITNFLSFDLGRPLHVFDADTIHEGLLIRFSKEGETLDALNGQTYTLNDQMTVIADSEKILALGGIMGGASSGCTLTTTNVFLEAAYFDPLRTAMTGRKLNLQSDARYRFERGIDPESTSWGIELASQLILDCCGGEVSEILEIGTPLRNTHEITLSLKKISTLIGCSVESSAAQSILEKLGCRVSLKNDYLYVTTPSWRHDLSLPEDLVEEILRVYGYEHIPLTPLPQKAEPTTCLTDYQQKVSSTRHLLANRGLEETVNWAMVDEKHASSFGGGHPSLRLTNPISLDLEYMRPTVLSALLIPLKRNLNRGVPSISLFELGAQYHSIHPQGQHLLASGIRCGKAHDDHWSGASRVFDAFDVKNDALAILEVFGLNFEKVQLSTQNLPAWYHPGRSGVIQQGPKTILGYFGEMHPGLLQLLDIKERVMAFELFLERLPLPKKKTSHKGVLQMSSFQSVERDFGFLAPRDVAAAQMMQAAKKADPKLIKDVTVFDLYMGKGIPETQKSIALRVRLEPTSATLTDDEIKAVYDKIVENISQATGAVLRR